jgi:hypothetical protein
MSDLNRYETLYRQIVVAWAAEVIRKGPNAELLADLVKAHYPGAKS